MSNIHGLFSNRREASSDDDADDAENRYVGGVDHRGGGSGLAVQPNNADGRPGGDILDNIRSNAAQAGGDEGPVTVSRRITMYRDGFTVDNGPYRSVHDPENSEFLTALARGMTPRELATDDDGAPLGDVTVGLVDKRNQDYVAPSGVGGGGSTFQSFSGQGTSLGSAGASSASEIGVITPGDSSPPEVDSSRPTTSIQIRLLNGKRLVVKVNLDNTVSTLGAHINASGDAGTEPYVLSSGFPPRVIQNLDQTVEVAGLKGAQVLQKKA